MDIGKRLALVRQSKGMTIKDVAEKTVKTYDRIETGKINVNFKMLLKICEVLKINIWDLVAPTLKIEFEEPSDMSF